MMTRGCPWIFCGKSRVLLVPGSRELIRTKLTRTGKNKKAANDGLKTKPMRKRLRWLPYPLILNERKHCRQSSIQHGRQLTLAENHQNRERN